MPSYNCGLAAGVAWKHASGSDMPTISVSDETPVGKFMLDMLENHVHDDDFFIPSSFLEGFVAGLSKNNLKLCPNRMVPYKAS
jgi:hypothetical protein